jgi:hypothetical protein
MFGSWDGYSGHMSLWRVKFWAWDGQSRDIDPITGEAIQSLNTTFIHAFTVEHVRELIESELALSREKIDSAVLASEDEEDAWSAGWNVGWEAGKKI